MLQSVVFMDEQCKVIYLFYFLGAQDFADPQVYEKVTSDVKTLTPNQSEAAAERC